MRISAVLILVLSLAACNRGVQNNDAVRQAVLDRLTTMGMNLAAMDIVVKSVQYNGDEADAAVSITTKGADSSSLTPFTYHLKREGSKWVVVGRQDSHGAGAAPGGAANPHGGGAMPPAADPHGGGMAAPGGGGKMPSPNDLPPTKK